MHRRPRLIVAAALAAPLLSSCGAAVGVDAAPDAAHPACAEVFVVLPDQLGDLPRRETTSQSSAAWGDPPVVLRCGVDPPGPTTEPCVGVGDVDWLQSGLDGGARFTTYGRVPALDVTVPDGLSADVVLGALAPAAAVLEVEARCL
ncbi:MAG TPA: DUF3515 family protein [Actinomycetales bacterium]|nr:DUF3515 family protein [Actinomycetales bacterium]